jgi:hypothetical protein
MTRRQLFGVIASLPFVRVAESADIKNDRVDQAMERGADYLLNAQQPSGEFSPKMSDAMTALGIMALASMGHQPSDPGKYGRVLRQALNFILREKPSRHYKNDPKLVYFGADGSRMYGHGITTLCLTEMLGMGVGKEQDTRLREVCKKALSLILRSQKVIKGNRFKGGWRYSPDSRDSDLSITAWQLLALRSGKGAGMDVPKESIDLAVRYLKGSYISRGNVKGCAYTPGGRHTLAMAAAGLLSLQVCGEYDSPEAKGSAEWLSSQNVIGGGHFYYSTYYYSQAMQKQGKVMAKKAREIVEKALLKKQQKNGSWNGNYGPVYCTSMAMLSLSVKYHYLPIYQH